MTRMFLNGAGMRGGPVHEHLAGAPLVREARTAPRYRFYSVQDRFPGLWPVADGGAAIAGEVYDVPLAVLRGSLLPSEPPELELGVVELDDGTASLAMLLRAPVLAGLPPFAGTRLTDITGHGGWRAYQRHLRAGSRA